MSVYIITTETFPNGMAATQRIRCYAKAISEKESCQVVVVNRLEDPNKPLGNTEPNGIIGNYTYKYIGGSTTKPNNKLKTVLVKVIDVIKLLLYLGRHLSEKDRVIFYSYNITLLHLITFVIHTKRAKIFYELCEHPSIQCSKCPSIPGEDIKWMKKNLSKCDGIIVISTLLEDLVFEVFNDRMKTLKLPALFESITENSKIREFNNGVPYIMHTGSLTQRKDGILHSLTAFGIAVNEYNLNIEYILTGNLESSPDRKEVLEVIDKYNIQNKVKFVGYLSNNDMIKYQQNAYMTIINKEDNLQNRYCFATKSCEYLIAECLLVTTNIGEICHFLTNKKNCILFTPGNIKELSKIIIEIVNDRSKRELIAKAGKELALNHFFCLNYSELLNRFIK